MENGTLQLHIWRAIRYQGKGGPDNLPSSVPRLGTQLSAVQSFFILLQPRAHAAADAGSCVTDLVTMAYHDYANTT